MLKPVRPNVRLDFLSGYNARLWITYDRFFFGSPGITKWRYNGTSHYPEEEDMIVTVSYEDGYWGKPYFDCGGGDIWMMTYTIPFFAFRNGTFYFK